MERRQNYGFRAVEMLPGAIAVINMGYFAHFQSPDAPAKAAAWKTKPSFGIVAGADRTINPDLERWMYKRAGARVTEVPGSSHVVMISHPDIVASVIEEAAK